METFTASKAASKNLIGENDEFKKRNYGKIILIVGHSNTTPILANKILGKQYYSEIDESIHGNLYIIQVMNDNNVTSQLLSLE